MSEDEQLPTDGPERIDDLAAYRYLLDASRQAHDLSDKCWSQTASLALKVTSIMVRAMASAVYLAVLHPRD